MSDAKTSLVAMALTSSLVEDALIDSGGEINEVVEGLMDIRDVQLPAAVDRYAAIILRCESLKNEYLKRAEVLENIAKGFDRYSERLESKIKEAMGTLQTDTLAGFDTEFKLVLNNPAVFVESEEAIPEAYKSQKIEIKIDKKRIAEDLKLGVPVEGCRLERSRRLVSKPKRKEIA